MMKRSEDLPSDYEYTAKRVYVDYCIRSDYLNAIALTNELGIQPSRSWSKDEEYFSNVYDPATKNVTKVLRKRPWGIWALETKSLKTKNIEEHFGHLFQLLEPKADVIRQYLADDLRYSIRFYIWWQPLEGHGGYSLHRNTIEKAIAFCHYMEFGCIS